MDLDKSENIKIALIGCGNWGKNIARNLSEMNALSCIYDPHSNIAKKISDDLELPNYSLKEIFSNEGIDGIVIASSSDTHMNIAKQALLNNKDVLIEKPFCLSLSEAKNISNLAEKKNKVLMAGHLLNYHKAFIKKKNLIAPG